MEFEEIYVTFPDLAKQNKTKQNTFLCCSKSFYFLLTDGNPGIHVLKVTELLPAWVLQWYIKYSFPTLPTLLLQNGTALDLNGSNQKISIMLSNYTFESICYLSYPRVTNPSPAASIWDGKI